MSKDWTAVDGEGPSNSSYKYLTCVNAVDEILRNSGHDLVNGNHEMVSRLIVSTLAHVHGLAPKELAAQ